MGVTLEAAVARVSRGLPVVHGEDGGRGREVPQVRKNTSIPARPVSNTRPFS